MADINIENNSITEDVELINAFLNANSLPSSINSKKQNNNGTFFKTLTNKIFKPNYISGDVLKLNSGGKYNLSDIIDFSSGSGNIVQEKLEDLRFMSTSRYRQYMAYEQMAEDPVISTALDMYADDATQTDASGKRIWVTSDEDSDISDIVSGIFEKTKLSTKIWKIARLLAEYGDVYVELIYDERPTSQVKIVESKLLEVSDNINAITGIKLVNSKGHILNDIKIITDAENIFDLQINGRTICFAKLFEKSANLNSGYISPKAQSEDVSYFPADKFVHYYLDQSDKRNGEYFDVQLDDGGTLRFEVARGKSMIHDLYTTWRDLQLLEYSIMLNRAAKSSIFRFVQIEVGNMSKSNVDVTLRKVKNLIENKLTMNTVDNTYKPYNDPGPIENYIYIPTRNQQGSISVNTVGGDVNIKDIADLEYYQNKLFAGLKIPREFLNYDGNASVFNSGEALTKLDARYARTVKRLQSFIISSTQKLVDLFLINRGLKKYIDQYEVKMVIPSTVEDNDRIDSFNQKIELANNLTDSLSKFMEMEGVTLNIEKYVDYLAEEIFGDAFIKEVITVDKNAIGTNLTGGESPSFGGPSSFGNDFGGFTEEPEEDNDLSGTIDFNPPEETETSPEIEGGENLGELEDYSGEWADLT